MTVADIKLSLCIYFIGVVSKHRIMTHSDLLVHHMYVCFVLF